MLSSPFRLLFGYGFRSAEFNIIGFPVESSYIVLCLEIGVLSAALLIGLFLLSALKMVLIGRLGAYADEGRIYQFFGLAIVAFMVHSAFNRYLVGIGNPASLMALMMMSAFGVRQRFLAKRLAPPQFSTPTLPRMGNLS
ncbi:hypothetical protein [Variovorax sp. PAMC 28711]|uniref:hypothetical protein n=1 Tax=Variovorax sp. PAMC 28711 TaxID=1795631 RepID=UPI0012E8627B|nr:hypothetical protein [Variovorax sp. PAMC 28711]